MNSILLLIYTYLSILNTYCKRYVYFTLFLLYFILTFKILESLFNGNTSCSNCIYCCRQVSVHLLDTFDLPEILAKVKNTQNLPTMTKNYFASDLPFLYRCICCLSAYQLCTCEFVQLCPVYVLHCISIDQFCILALTV